MKRTDTKLLMALIRFLNINLTFNGMSMYPPRVQSLRYSFIALGIGNM
jgi:hypothetical protein